MTAPPSQLGLQSRVADTIERYGLLAPVDRVLVAFSGGADSTALVLLLRGLGYDLVLGHVDHAMRGGSEDDAAHCRTLAATLGIPILLRRLDPAPRGEAQAREMRYEVLASLAEVAGATRIATGHTLDDVAETVLLRLERGGFPLGIPPRRDRIVRPLLWIRRSETEEVCRRAGVDFVVDPTNTDERFARNRIRLRVMPHLSEADVEALAEVAESNRLWIETLEEEVGRALRSGWLRVDPDGIRVRRSWLNAVSPAISRRVIRWMIERLGLEATSALVADVERKVAAKTGSRLDLPSGFVAWCEPEWLIAGRPPPAAALREVELLVGGRTRAVDWGIEIHLDVIPLPAEIAPADAGANAALVDADKAVPPLVLRSRREGDRFVPLGGRTRKLQDLFVDLKIPRAQRDRVPIIVSGDRIVWVAGVRIGDRFKLTPESKRALRIRIFPAVAGPVSDP